METFRVTFELQAEGEAEALLLAQRLAREAEIESFTVEDSDGSVILSGGSFGERGIIGIKP